MGASSLRMVDGGRCGEPCPYTTRHSAAGQPLHQEGAGVSRASVAGRTGRVPNSRTMEPCCPTSCSNRRDRQALGSLECSGSRRSGVTGRCARNFGTLLRRPGAILVPSGLAAQRYVEQVSPGSTRGRAVFQGSERVYQRFSESRIRACNDAALWPDGGRLAVTCYGDFLRTVHVRAGVDF